jgi:hypothetical protein
VSPLLAIILINSTAGSRIHIIGDFTSKIVPFTKVKVAKAREFEKNVAESFDHSDKIKLLLSLPPQGLNA